MTRRISPQEAWETLKAGNERFAHAQLEHPNLDADRRTKLREGQNPYAVVLACSDSRVPVEHVFDAGLGDMFVVRTAGEILGESVLGSMAFAINSLNVPLVVVLGHEGCGAVHAASEALSGNGFPDDHQRVLIERVAPSILHAQARGLETSKDYEIVHAEQTAKQLQQHMPTMVQKIEDGDLGLVACRYRQRTGEIDVVYALGVE